MITNLFSTIYCLKLTTQLSFPVSIKSFPIPASCLPKLQEKGRGDMYSFKDKLSDKLSLLFSDSPSTPPQPQATQYSKEGKSLSSLLSYVLPSTSFNGSRSECQNNGVEPTKSHPVRWKSRIFSQQDVPLENYVECKYICVNEAVQCKETNQGSVIHQAFDEEENFCTPKENEDQGSRCISGSDTFEDATDQLGSGKPMPKLTQESLFLSADLYEFLQSSLPNIVKGCEWMLLYSTVKHGISLRTLIRKSADLPGPCLLITGDMQGAIFGGLFEGPLIPTAKRKYQGTNQTFVFTTIDGEPSLFRPNGANRYFLLCLNDMLALGGGSDFALRLDGDLLSGTSGPCDTFGNKCLAHNQEFELKNVELWGFTHLSRYT